MTSPKATSASVTRIRILDSSSPRFIPEKFARPASNPGRRTRSTPSARTPLLTSPTRGVHPQPRFKPNRAGVTGLCQLREKSASTARGRADRRQSALRRSPPRQLGDEATEPLAPLLEVVELV